MAGSDQLVRDYLAAFYAGDAVAARALMADDFHFTGPASAHFHDADSFLKASAHAAAGTRGIDIDQVFVDGDAAAAFYTLSLDHRVGRMAVAERFRIANGRIAASTLIMDTAPFIARDRPANTAVDPVCHMEVDRAAPAATREFEGRTYYFCSTGCAEAFARDPRHYLAA